MTLRVNYKKLGKNLDSAVGGITNESRFEKWFEDTYIREHRKFTLPTLSGGGRLIIEQGWNQKAKQKRIIKVKVMVDEVEREMLFRLEDFEQAVFAMTQADEVLKYVKGEARNQRKYSEEVVQKPIN